MALVYHYHGLLASGQLHDQQTIWSWSPFSCGDNVSQLKRLQGRDNTTTNRIRLAASARCYQPVDRLALGLQERHRADWEELYADWQPDDPLKYY